MSFDELKKVPGLAENLEILDDEQKEQAEMLVEAGQADLFKTFPAPGQKDDDKIRLLEQADKLNAQYPGGLKTYVENARKLLEDSRNGVNPFEGMKPSVPMGESLEAESNAFAEAEATGMGEIGKTAFVLVAGGLGERLGYSGIKVALPTEVTTGTTYLEYYIKHILAWQERAGEGPLPLAIMTSGDTHDLTVKFLKTHGYFGMPQEQITLIKQEKVPSLIDNNGHFAVKEDDPFEIETKPHGHGDVHALLASSGLAKKWADEGRKWLVFFQDTNALAFKAILPAIGVSREKGFEVNSLTVPRKAGEAAGGIVKLEKEDGSSITINVEYNQLDPLLRATVNPEGDVPDETGFSPYPGNINILVFAIPPYAKVLEKTGGAIPEFVNPKYADAEKTTFKKPTRLECMMQDYPKLLGAESRVGFTRFDRWVSFSAVKNRLEDAAEKSKKDLPPESASSGEADLYLANRKLMRIAGADIQEDKMVSYAGIDLPFGARIVLDPKMACCLADLKKRFNNVKLSARSVLVVEGGDVCFENLELDGALVVKATEGAKVKIHDLNISNAGWNLEEISPDDTDMPEELRIRGYKPVRGEERMLIFEEAGEFSVDGNSFSPAD